MKKAVLFAILALSINAFAQNNQPTSNSTAKIRGMMEFKGRTASDNQLEMNYSQGIKHQAPNQDSLVQIFDSIYYWQWDTISVGWKIINREIDIVYDAHNNLTSSIEERWNDSIWVNSSKAISTYDGNHNMTSFTLQSWNGIAWVNAYQYTYTYDINNNQTNILRQNWDGSVWVNHWQYFYTYDTNNNQTSFIRQIWKNNAWVNTYQYTYTYDINNNQTSELDQNWNGSVWVNTEQYTYTYDVNNKRISGLDQSWNDSVWVNSTQSNYTYDANNNLTNILYQVWNGSVWVISSQDIYTYDANNNQTSELYKTLFNGAWVNLWQELTTYDANNFLKSDLFKDWNILNNVVTDGDSTYYYYHTILGINNLKLLDACITVYPNPTSGKFTISSKSIISSVEIYNLHGQRIDSDFKINRQTSTEIDLSSHSKGIYILNIHSGTKIYNCKIVVQ